MTKDEITTLTDSINGNIGDLKKSIDKKVSAEDLEAKFGEVCEKLDKFVDDKGVLILPDSFGKQQEQLDDISTQIKQIGELQDSKVKGIDEQLDIALKGMFADNGVLKNRKTTSKAGDIGHMELKASPLLTSAITDSTSGFEGQTEPGVDSAPWRLTPIWNAIRKGTIGAGRDSINWWEETTRGDKAAFVTEATGASSQDGSFKTWTKQSMDIKMLMDFTKVSGTMLEDFEYIKSEINDLLTNGIPRKRESELWDGDGSGTHLKGIEEYAQPFDIPTNYDKVPNATDADVLMAAILQVNNGAGNANKKGFNPNLAMVNPGTITNMQSIKKADGTYIIPPFMGANGLSIGGVKLIPNLDIDAGEFIVGDFNMAKAYMKRNMRISFHYENGTDVLSDLVLVMASMRLAGLKVTASQAYAFVSGSFATGKALIEETVG